MKILPLNKKQLESFKELDPFEFCKRTDISMTLQLGALFEAEDDPDGLREGNLPAGLLLGTKKEDSLILIWLFVDPARRRKGYGEALLSEAFNEAEREGLKQVTALFPTEYGRELICKGEREYFAMHGFAEAGKGMMVMTVADHLNLPSYEGPSFFEEAFALDDLLTEDLETEAPDEGSAQSDYDDKEFFEHTHKGWDIKLVSLEEFSHNTYLRKAGKKILTGKAPVRAGTIGELTLSQYRQILRLCEKNGHSGFPENLFEIPADYFDLDVSSYVQEDTDRDGDYTDESVCGVCLIHYNRLEKALYAELLYAVGKEFTRSLGELVRCSIIAALNKYPPDMKLILPCDHNYHGALMEKLGL